MPHSPMLITHIKYKLGKEIILGMIRKNNASKMMALKYYFGVPERQMLHLLLFLFSCEHFSHMIPHYQLNYICQLFPHMLAKHLCVLVH